MSSSTSSPFVTYFSNECDACGACRKVCPFLAEYGSPQELARRMASGEDSLKNIAFECSLCGLCSTVCHARLTPQDLFLELRRNVVRQGHADLKKYSRLLAYEKKGGSPLFSASYLPKDCRTVFFPGCTLSGTRSGVVRELVIALRSREPALGVELNCCSKPTHDTGLQDVFEERFGAIMARWQKKGIRRVVTACPNCHKVFSLYGVGLEVVSVYELLADDFAARFGKGAVTVHDACPLREQPQHGAAVRRLLENGSVAVREMPSRGKRTLCCGEGGAVGAVRPDFAKAWTDRRVDEAGGVPIVTYCAGCTGFLGRKAEAFHVLDLVFPGHRVHSAPFTYAARLMLKRWLAKKIGHGE